MRPRRSLKSRNVPTLITFTIWCLTLYVVSLSGRVDFWSRVRAVFGSLSAEEGLVVAMAPILVLVLTSIMSSNGKARIVFWRWRNALPGHRCFSELAPADPRIDMKRLEARLGSMPSEPGSQNTKWFELSRRYADTVTVKEAHRHFLLARDLCAISLVFSVVAPISVFFVQGEVSWAVFYLFVMAVHYLALAIVARNQGRRFVCNVIVEYLMDKQ